MLTSTYHIVPAEISSSASFATLEQDVLIPLKNLRDKGEVQITDFTSLLATWRGQFASKACIH